MKQRRKEIMKKDKRNLKRSLQEKGITLVALVITIIILIILATVTINMAFGDNGLIRQAELARDLTANSTKYEEESTANLVAYMNEVMREDSEIVEPDTRSEIAKARDEGTVFDKTTSRKDDSGDEVWIPGGFKVAGDSATDADDGVVITDGTNEFVWIPVDDYTMMYTEAADTALSGSSAGVTATTDVYSKLRIRSGDSSSYTAGLPNSTNAREPDILTNTTSGDASTSSGIGIDQLKNVLGITGDTNAEVLNNFATSLVEEYIATYNSIKTYGGFYIGRYEVTGTIDNPSVQKEQAVITNQNWYYLKKACTNIVSTEYAQTTMVYGNQWDEVMSWLVATGAKTDSEVNTDSSSWGNYNNSSGDAAIEGAGTKQVSGYSEYWQANNIYDLAGNCWEWTQEANSTNNRVNRGRLLLRFQFDLSSFKP